MSRQNFLLVFLPRKHLSHNDNNELSCWRVGDEFYRRRSGGPGGDLRWRSSLRLAPAPPIYEVMGDHGSPPGPPLRLRLFTWILWYLSFIYSGCGAHLGAGVAKIHVVLCNHGVERMILQLYVRLPGGSSVLHALCNTLSIKILRFLKLSPHLPGGMFFS